MPELAPGQSRRPCRARSRNIGQPPRERDDLGQLPNVSIIGLGRRHVARCHHLDEHVGHFPAREQPATHVRMIAAKLNALELDRACRDRPPLSGPGSGLRRPWLGSKRGCRCLGASRPKKPLPQTARAAPEPPLARRALRGANASNIACGCSLCLCSVPAPTKTTTRACEPVHTQEPQRMLHGLRRRPQSHHGRVRHPKHLGSEGRVVVDDLGDLGHVEPLFLAEIEHLHCDRRDGRQGRTAFEFLLDDR